MDNEPSGSNDTAGQAPLDGTARRRRAARKQIAPAEEAPLVLIAEDEEPIATALAIIVEDAGYRALIAPHGQTALTLALELHPALILTDLMMPYLDGASLIAALHQAMDDDGRRAPPIVLVTAAGMRQAHAAGADALLRKPFSLEEVEALLWRFLEP